MMHLERWWHQTPHTSLLLSADVNAAARAWPQMSGSGARLCTVTAVWVKDSCTSKRWKPAPGPSWTALGPGSVQWQLYEWKTAVPVKDESLRLAPAERLRGLVLAARQMAPVTAVPVKDERSHFQWQHKLQTLPLQPVVLPSPRPHPEKIAAWSRDSTWGTVRGKNAKHQFLSSDRDKVE